MKCHNILLMCALMIVGCTSTHKESEGSAKWSEKYPGVWVSEVGTPEDFNLLNSVGSVAQSEALKRRSQQDLPFANGEVRYITKNGRTYITLPIEKDEQIYGLGLNFKKLNQRGEVKRLHMDHYKNVDNGRTHAPVPFFVSSKGYGMFFNSARYIDVWVTSAVRRDSENPPVSVDRTSDPKHWTARPFSDNMEILIPADGVELVLFSGDSMLDVVSRYTLYSGGGFIPPKWGLGFWQRTPTKYTSEDVKAEVDGFKEHKFPLDVIGLEPGWHSFAYPCSYEWDKGRYPEPKKFVEQMADQGIKLNLWANPYVAESSSLYEPLSKYSGSHTVWCGLVPDYTMPEAKSIFQDHIQRNQLDYGISGYKMDEVDGYDNWLWPDVATFPSGRDGEQMRSVYGNLVMETILESYKAANKRTYGMVRAVNAGGSKMPFVIYSDNYLHRDFIAGICSASFIGVHWTPEVRNSKSSEEWLRRMQTTCFSPMAIVNAWASGTKPWSFDDVYEECLEVATLRMRLLPYIYSIFAEYYLEGTPPFMAMPLVEGFEAKSKVEKGVLDDTDNPYAEAKTFDVNDQYMMGRDILVAPLFAGEGASRKVVLPRGKWYDFYSGELVGESEVITITPTDSRIPLFVRDGAVIPMMDAVLNSSEWRAGVDLEVRLYGSKPSTFRLYDDDGDSFDYERGKFSIKELSSDKSVKDIVSNSDWSYKNIKWVEM